MSVPSYYRPFTTEKDPDPDSDSDSDSGFSDTSARRLDDPRYAIIRAAGPSLNTAPEQLFYQSLQARNQFAIGYAYNQSDMYDPSMNIPLAIPFLPFLPTNQTTHTSLFSFSSANRDTNAYPLSTFFTIKTPRTYNNITLIQFVQINFPYFLNSIPDASTVAIDISKYVASNIGLNWSNCYKCIGNSGAGYRGMTTSINGGSFSEAGRTNPAATSKELVHTFTVRGGAYDANSLAIEMDKQMNITPPFNIISYTEHRQLFIAIGNVDHLFNDPGRWYYSPSTGNYIRSASKSLIISDYLPNIHIAGAVPTEKEIFVAYFYPVLRAALNSTYDSKFLDVGSYTATDIQQQVVTTYQGLSSQLYYELCYNNLATLKLIRQMHTFEYNPINSYNYTYSPANNKMIVTHTDLHPSIQKDIQTVQEINRAKAAADYNMHIQDLQTLNADIQNTSGIVADLSKQIQTALVEVGVPYNTYTNAALAEPTTPILLQNKKILVANQMTESDDALIALTLGPVPLSPPAIINRAFPASFGWTTLQQLVADASYSLIAPSGTRAYTRPYLQQLQQLNQSSQLQRAGSFANRSLNGVSVGCSNFQSLFSTFVNYYSTNTGLITKSAAIQSNTLAATSNYVNKKYGSVFPPPLLENNNYLNGKGTGAVTFYSSKNIHYASTPDDSNDRSLRSPITDVSNCCAYVNAAVVNFYSCLPAEYVVTTPFYKLGYGINDIFSIYSTNSLAVTSSVNNIYIQLNTEQPLNNMDIAGKENFNITNEPTGEYKKVFGKLLTQGSTSGQVTQTIVQTPAKFPVAPLASLDHFSFNFFLDTMVPLNRLYPFLTVGTDWNAIIQIDEQTAAFKN
jgi:hypothetical protein